MKSPLFTSLLLYIELLVRGDRWEGAVILRIFPTPAWWCLSLFWHKAVDWAEHSVMFTWQTLLISCVCVAWLGHCGGGHRVNCRSLSFVTELLAQSAGSCQACTLPIHKLQWKNTNICYVHEKCRAHLTRVYLLCQAEMFHGIYWTLSYVGGLQWLCARVWWPLESIGCSTTISV